MKPTRTRRAIEHRPKTAPRALRAAPILIALWLLGWVPAGPVFGQPPAAGSLLAAAETSHDLQPPGADATHAQERAPEEEAGSHGAQSPWALVARLFNFALLAGTLVYFLRSPLMAFLKARGIEIRASLATAAELKTRAAQQIEEVERRLAALPAEIAALEARGAEEIASEQARITSAADAERARLVEQARRQIDLQLREARRDLTAHAAGLAVARATERIKAIIQDEDQLRLVDSYLARVGTTPPSEASDGGATATGGRP